MRGESDYEPPENCPLHPAAAFFGTGLVCWVSSIWLFGMFAPSLPGSVSGLMSLAMFGLGLALSFKACNIAERERRLWYRHQARLAMAATPSALLGHVGTNSEEVANRPTLMHIPVRDPEN